MTRVKPEDDEYCLVNIETSQLCCGVVHFQLSSCSLARDYQLPSLSHSNITHAASNASCICLAISSGAVFVADLCREKHFGTAMGTCGRIFDIGHAAGPIFEGFLLSRHNYLFSFRVIAGMLLLAVPLFVMTVQVKKA